MAEGSPGSVILLGPVSLIEEKLNYIGINVRIRIAMNISTIISSI